jgi:hypothetical protein
MGGEENKKEDILASAAPDSVSVVSIETPNSVCLKSLFVHGELGMK